MHKNFTPVKAKKLFKKPVPKKSSIFLAVFGLVMIAASETQAQQIWNSGSLTFSYTGPGQQDCITAQTCLTRTTVLLFLFARQYPVCRVAGIPVPAIQDGHMAI